MLLVINHISFTSRRNLFNKDRHRKHVVTQMYRHFPVWSPCEEGVRKMSQRKDVGCSPFSSFKYHFYASICISDTGKYDSFSMQAEHRFDTIPLN